MVPANRDRSTTVRDITVRRTEAVDVEFDDGTRATFSLAELRRNCPCAGCRNARDEGRSPWSGDDDTLSVRDAELVGAWGLRLVWQDGHGTGIFPWERLRAWAESGRFHLPPDSGLADR